jgi:hypothetical protein
MTAKHLTALFLVSAVAAAFAIAGCGSDSSSAESFAEATMPLKEYAHKTDLICGEGSIEQGELAGAYLQKHPKAEELEMVVPAIVPPIEKEIKELRELGLPSGREEEAEAFVEEMEAALAALKRDPEGLSKQDNPFEKSNQLAAKLGLGDCSQNP